jgi:hypothetical protein
MANLPNYLVCPGCHNDEDFHHHPDAPAESDVAICEECGNRVLYEPDEDRSAELGDEVYLVEHSIAYEGIISVRGPFISLTRAEANGVPDHAYHRKNQDGEYTSDPWIFDSGKMGNNDTYTVKQRTLQ